jgi:hypothetical protein
VLKDLAGRRRITARFARAVRPKAKAPKPPGKMRRKSMICTRWIRLWRSGCHELAGVADYLWLQLVAETVRT